jgi:hypothetical protein
VFFSIGAGAIGDCDWFFQANLSDIVRNVIEDPLVSFPWV